MARPTLRIVDFIDDAVPKCPKCLVLLDVDEESGLIYLECPVCKDVFL